MKRAVILFAEGYETVEALLVVDLLRRGGVEVTMASITEDEFVRSSHGVNVEMDAVLGEVDVLDYDAIILPGGMPGTRYLAAYKPLTDLLESFYNKGGKVAAICAAPSIFAQLGFLKGRKATSYPSFMDKLEGAVTTEEPVAVDGNVTTSRGLGTAIDFALSLIGQLEGMEKAKEIGESIVYF